MHVGVVEGLLLVTGPASGEVLGWTHEDQYAHDRLPAHLWLKRYIGFETRGINSAAVWHPEGGRLPAVNPLTLMANLSKPVEVPDGPATVSGLRESEHGRAAAMILVWPQQQHHVTCGEVLGTIGMDEGLDRLLPPEDIAAGAAFAPPIHGDEPDSPNAAWLLEDRSSTSIHLPVADAGWSDSEYPIVSLRNADGQVIALYTQFLVQEDVGWLLPLPCPDTGD